MKSQVPCLDENDLVRFLEGHATTADEDHIDGCADCRALVTELGRAIEPVSEPAEDDELVAWELTSGAELVARGAKVGRYVVLDAIGAGAMGVVYRAYDPELDRDVALKLLRVLGDAARGDQARARLVREAQSLAKVAHPNVVSVFDASSYGAHVYVAMELVDGADLAAWLETPRSWREITRVFIAAGRGLAAAHAAGVVHRDVKPANILIGHDGRARMTDFGLASSVEAAADGVVGTPAFMAPEVKAGIAADARSDQYSFAASLIASLPPGTLRSLLARAHAEAPADRYPDMTTLLDALERALVPTARRLAPAAAAVLVGLVGGGAVYLATRAPAATCPAPRSRLVGVWDDARKAQLHGVFVASGHPLAEGQWTRAEASLDAFATAWGAAYTDACEATSVRHEQSAALLDLRMTCLQGERARLVVATEMFEHADRAVVGRAIGLADLGVDRVKRCSDPAALRAAQPLPLDPVLRARAIAATAQLAFVESVSLRGQYDMAIAGARTVHAEAIAIGDARLEADAQRSLGETQWRAGKYTEANATLQLAIDAAKRANDPQLEAGALIDLVAVLIEDAKYPEAMQVSRIAEATVRASHDERQLATLSGNRGAIYYLQANYAAARTDYEAARTLFARLYGDNDRRVGQATMNLAMVAGEVGDVDPLPLYDRAIAILQKALGPSHPEVALGRSNRAIALANAKRHAEALRELDAVLAARIEVLGSDHRDTIGTLMMMGAVVTDAGDYTAALAHYQAVLARYQGTMRADHPLLASARMGIGRALNHLGRSAEAIAPLELAVATFAKEKLQTPIAGTAHLELATALWNTGGDRGRARASIATAGDVAKAANATELAAEVAAWRAAHP